MIAGKLIDDSRPVLRNFFVLVRVLRFERDQALVKQQQQMRMACDFRWDRAWHCSNFFVDKRCQKGETLGRGKFRTKVKKLSFRISVEIDMRKSCGFRLDEIRQRLAVWRREGDSSFNTIPTLLGV